MRIQISDDIKTDDINGLIKAGAKFIAYQYIISVPLFPPTKRFSKLYFITQNEKTSKYSLKYNLLCIFLGLWGLPFGPPSMIRTIISNLRGGLDLTDDVLVNMKQDTLSKKEIELVKPSKFFIKPSKSNLTELQKVFKSVKNYIIINEPILVGYFINTDNNEKAYYVIGLSIKLDDDNLQIIRKQLYKRFLKHTKFEIVSLLDNNYEHIERFKSEGIKIKAG